ncbi:MAG: hypothetical protein H6Q33_107 [Deltaproteobacteria bacterium]|nr:hypothetical protein [Deltaproteobacteria bacterium]
MTGESSLHQSPALAAAWKAYCDGLAELRTELFSADLARDPADQVKAQYWLLQAQAAAFNLVIAPDTGRPRFLVHTVFEPSYYTWLLPNADFLYRYAFVDGARTFRIRGTRRNARFLELQVISGFWGDPAMRMRETYDFDKFAIAADGTFEVMVGPQPQPGMPDWITTDPATNKNTLLVREAFYDWGREEASDLRIEAVDNPSSGADVVDEAELLRRMDAALRMIWFCHKTFSGQLTMNVMNAVGVNRFLLVDTSKNEAAANPSAGYIPAVFDLDADEALIVEFEVPRARYWSIHLGDVWFQVADFVYHQSSLNGHQTLLDPDGKARIVIAARDPGVANWLDTVGNRRGVALLRWYFTDRYPVPATTKVKLSRLFDHLPPETCRVSADDRARHLRERRESALRRYGY